MSCNAENTYTIGTFTSIKAETNICLYILNNHYTATYSFNKQTEN